MVRNLVLDGGITALPSPTVSGQLVWGFDNVGNDSLACDTIVNSYAGKIVMVRRGVCNFSQKIYNAQQAGAIGCVVCNNPRWYCSNQHGCWYIWCSGYYSCS
jgi:hypothetical protein